MLFAVISLALFAGLFITSLDAAGLKSAPIASALGLLRRGCIPRCGGVLGYATVNSLRCDMIRQFRRGNPAIKQRNGYQMVPISFLLNPHEVIQSRESMGVGAVGEKSAILV